MWDNCLDDLTAVVDTIYYAHSLNSINDCNYYLDGEFNVNFLDDTERKIFVVRKLGTENQLQLDYWIEGVGSISGVLESARRFMNCDLCGMQHMSLLCHFEDDEPILKLIWTCTLSSTIVENNIQNAISVFPNPVTENAFTVEF